MDPHVAVEHDQFVQENGDEAYAKLRANSPILSVSRTLDQSRLFHPIADIFRRCCFISLLKLACPFHSDMLFDFYTNFATNSNFTLFKSRVFFINIEFTKEEMALFLDVPTGGPSTYIFSRTGRATRWSQVNEVLRGTNLSSHSQTVSELLREPRIAQHVIRNSILPKSGDRPKITPILSTVTYYALTGTNFDVPDLLIRYMMDIAETREPHCSRKMNLALGHVIAHLIKAKYDLDSPKEPDVAVQYYSNKSFVRFYAEDEDPSKKKKKRRGEVFNEEEEDEEIHLHDTRGRASGSGTSETLEDKIEQLRFRVEQNEINAKERHDSFVTESRENWAWLKSRFDRDT